MTVWLVTMGDGLVALVDVGVMMLSPQSHCGVPGASRIKL